MLGYPSLRVMVSHRHQSPNHRERTREGKEGGTERNYEDGEGARGLTCQIPRRSDLRECPSCAMALVTRAKRSLINR